MQAEKVDIFGALSLYLDFVNLFQFPDVVPGPDAYVAWAGVTSKVVDHDVQLIAPAAVPFRYA